MKKSNKVFAGFHLLTIIATVEGELDAKADIIIREYLSSESIFRLNLDDELDEIILLKESEYEKHFIQKAKDYFDDSTKEERDEFEIFAKELILADEEITEKENKYFALLLKTWQEKEKEQK